MNFKNVVGKTIAILAIVSLLSITGCSNTNQAANNTTPKQKTTQNVSNGSNNTTPSNNAVLNPNTLSNEEVASRLQKIDSEIAQQEQQQNNNDSNNTAAKTSTSSDNPSSYTAKETSVSTSTEKFIITVQGKRYHKPNCPTIKQVKASVTRDEAESMGYTPCGVCHL